MKRFILAAAMVFGTVGISASPALADHGHHGHHGHRGHHGHHGHHGHYGHGHGHGHGHWHGYRGPSLYYYSAPRVYAPQPYPYYDYYSPGYGLGYSSPGFSFWLGR